MKKIFLSIILFANIFIMHSQTSTLLKEGSRQVHLDFHTSEHILDIGNDFDKKQFQEALKLGNVNSINIFAKGHHGWSYYPTKYGNVHPNLSFDLLKAQIEACHEIGVRVQAYITVGWSQNDYLEHPEWAIVNKAGKTYVQKGAPLPKIEPGDSDKPLPDTYWTLLSPEGEYLDLILKQTEEIVKDYDVDGIWYDIIAMDGLNYSTSSLEDMKQANVDINNDKQVNRHHVGKMHKFFGETSSLIIKYKPNSSIFYNWSNSFRFENVYNDTLYMYNTKQDLEDLPTTWDGYDVFPMRAKFFDPVGQPVVAMSGKFHTAWGEFGGFKNKEAMWYEAASMIAFGAATNFGDQLHPSGIMELETYKNIGYAFDYVEKIEDYGVVSDDVASLGVLLSYNKPHDEGTIRMLLEEQVDFVVINKMKNWEHLETLILNGGVRLTDRLLLKVNAFIKKGGKLLVMGEGTLDEANTHFMVNIGAKYIGSANYDIDYTLVEKNIGNNLPASPYLNYYPAVRVEPIKGTEVLAHIHEPFFSRTIKHYSSHRNTPYKMERATHPAIVESSNTIYIAHALGKQYFEVGAKVHRDIFRNALNRVHEKPMVIVDLPSAGRVNLLHQPQENRYVAHLLYAVPIQRGIAQVIEDIVPIYNIKMKINITEKVKRCYTIPGNKEITFNENYGEIELIVPEIRGHQAVVFEYQ